jgi:hypothetical protein
MHQLCCVPFKKSEALRPPRRASKRIAMAPTSQRRAELKRELVQKLCDKHGVHGGPQRARIERAVEGSEALRSNKPITPGALDELESAVASVVEATERAGRAALERKDFNAKPDMGSRLLNLNFSGGGYSSSRPRPRNTETWDRFRDVSSNEDMKAEFIVQHHLQKDAVGEYVEKALRLHDDRKGMPVVSSPVWAFVPAGKK